MRNCWHFLNFYRRQQCTFSDIHKITFITFVDVEMPFTEMAAMCYTFEQWIEALFSATATTNDNRSIDQFLDDKRRETKYYNNQFKHTIKGIRMLWRSFFWLIVHRNLVFWLKKQCAGKLIRLVLEIEHRFGHK